MRKMKVFVSLLLAAALLLGAPLPKAEAAGADFDGKLYSKACALMDGDSGRVLYGKEDKIPLANASTTKILTCILALEFGDSESVVTASKNAANQPKVHLGMREGEQFYLKDLLYAMMLESYNDAAVAIAEHIAGTTEDFAALMNGKAAEIGCCDTCFITPNGLDAADENGMHHTTAADLCRIMKYCAWDSKKAEKFLSITECRTYDFVSLSGTGYRCTNKNSFLDMMDGVITGKTGFTGKAGYCYVAAYEKDGKRFCIALLACGWPNNKKYKWADAKRLLEYGIMRYEKKQIVIDKKLEPVEISGGMTKKTLRNWKEEVYITPELTLDADLLEYLLCEEDAVSIEVTQKKKLSAPVYAGQQVGEVRIKLNGETLHAFPIVSADRVDEWELTSFITCVFRYYLL